jgi:PDZ domain-containing protein
MKRGAITLRVGRVAVELGASWFLVAPAALWAIATVYVPIMAPFLSNVETWGVALGIVLLVGVSLVTHALAHAGVARIVGGQGPERLPLYPFGDAAQVWPTAPSPWREVPAAMAGPLANLLLAGLGYLIWDRQLHTYLNVSALFLAVLNAALAAVNLTPCFPLDGGRLLRAIVGGLLRRPTRATRLGVQLGRLFVAFLAVWGIFLIAQRARFSLETGAGTLIVAALLGLALWRQPAREWEARTANLSTSPVGLGRRLVAGFLVLVLTVPAFSLLPTVNGLEAPGVAIEVEPMISVPPEYRHPHRGNFILTSVLAQTPIVMGQWVYGKLNPVVKIVPPERIVPPDVTPQELMRRNFRMLEESETIATVVALRLAGYEVQFTGQGAGVVSVLPESPAHGVLQPGDRIVALNGTPIETADELAARIRAQDPHATVELVVKRDGQRMELRLPLMEPTAPGEPPRLGIVVQTAGFDVEFPFPVEVRPQKIAGGPSAGLMFTLTIYNLITPEDLTGGRRIAGTGTIDLEGRVGPIGGVEQKVASAERAGAVYFLVPPENYEAARRVARRIRVVKVATAQEAIEFLQGISREEAD